MRNVQPLIYSTPDRIGSPHDPPPNYTGRVEYHGQNKVLWKCRVEGYRLVLINGLYGMKWICTCPEYQHPKPNTPRAFCQHTQAAETIGLPKKIRDRKRTPDWLG